jgi:hypothetical protein
VDFDVVRRGEVIIAGVVLRSPALALEEGNRAKVLSAWENNLARTLPGTPATAYIDYSPDLNSYHTHIVGYRCCNLSQVEFGDVAARLPGTRNRGGGQDRQQQEWRDGHGTPPDGCHHPGGTTRFRERSAEIMRI